jgi:Na+-transporting methylmalonyl-CoA/oxaloacetate decarboxylase gamma subunit
MSTMTIALDITALGMGLVFGAIILLWSMMALLTALTAERESPADSPAADTRTESESMAHAAVIAVALALAEQHASTARPLDMPPTAIVSAWQLGMRSRQMYEKGIR